MATLTELHFDEQGIEFLLESDASPVVADLRRRAQNVVTQAKVNASGAHLMWPRHVSWHDFSSNTAGFANNPEGRGPNVVTERLRSGIHYEIGTDAEGKFALILSPTPYGYYLETGLKNGRTYPFLTPAIAAAAD